MDSNGRYTKNLFKISRQKQKRESPFLFLYVASNSLFSLEFTEHN